MVHEVLHPDHAWGVFERFQFELLYVEIVDFLETGFFGFDDFDDSSE